MEIPQTGERIDTLESALARAGFKAFDPSSDEASRARGQQDFGTLVSRAGTMALIQTLNALIKPGRVPSWLRPHLIAVLTLLPQRPDGVRSTLEFVFSAHPSSMVSTSEAVNPQKQGANITMEALKMASTLLSVPPASVTPERWYPGIAPQLLSLLDGKYGADLAKVGAYVIGFGILGRKQFGAPGTPGWKAFAEAMLTSIDPSLSSSIQTNEALIFSAGPDELVDLRRATTLVQSGELANALARLLSLLNSHPNPGLTKRLLAPLLLPLWALSSWVSPTEQIATRYEKPASTLLEIYLRLAGPAENFQDILSHLLFQGRRDLSNLSWEYEQVGDFGLQIKRLRGDSGSTPSKLDFAVVQSKVNAFIRLLAQLASVSDISMIFLDLLEELLQRPLDANDVKIAAADDEKTEDPTAQFVKAKVLQEMMGKLPDKLISNSEHMLRLVSKILSQFDEVPPATGDEATTIALSLLNLIVTAPDFQKSEVDANILTSIEASLKRISRVENADASQTARNLSLLLQYRDAVEDPDEQRPSAPTDRQIEDRKTYNLAISYITQTDSPPPVRSEGLNLLSILIKTNSSILDIPATLWLLSSLLNEEDDYINLRVMKVFTLVANKHPVSTTKEILEHYVDANEEEKPDTRLRFGEALLQIIQRLGQTFTGATSAQVGEALLAVASRRRHRPNTEARQERDERLARRKQEGTREEDLSSAGREDQTEEERARDAILAQIVSGWESKRGAEDIRLRASALSIFSTGIETNLVSGFSPSLIEAALDLCISVLTLETSPETAILRRAGIILVLTFVRSLAEAREKDRRLVFGLPDETREHLARVLEYVAQTDDDGLARQHALDVIESLENFQMVNLDLYLRARNGGAVGSPPSSRLVERLLVTRPPPSLPILHDPVTAHSPAGPGSASRSRIEEVE